ncbi:DUF488 family protein [Candidatus Bathyarchaeota archaeon]|nr:DUF488 domain-containing protein [Candidatus Bathyarchaeota archaeon]NIR15020.1 DUF488 domain-containing protein [Desulfobacterales bacterium]NIU81218.1 DUF488 family protein [Candidatus Bathyarchaeota archaeon]NIV67353.1 DUF488 family protein [Candidatus Bathyarchaeota archaeon]NIW34450.1 DUF488 family protein [Candidatus Bathyarchaeota archaeon]
MRIFTIGFARKSAEEFFKLLKQNEIQRLIDIRLRNTNQLAGFTKKADLKFFLKEILGCEYHHFEFLAPTEQIIKAYRKTDDWVSYEKRYLQLLEGRKVAERLDKKFFEERTCCFLCSEPTPKHCHRRLVAEYLANLWGDVEIIHL